MIKIYNDNGILESKEEVEEVKGFKNFLLVDIENKRKIKESIPTLILNLIGKNAGISPKLLENKIVSSSSIVIKNKKIEVEKTGKNFRDFIKNRISKVISYYTAEDVKRNIFGGLSPLIVDKTENKIRLYLTYSVKAI